MNSRSKAATESLEGSDMQPGKCMAALQGRVWCERLTIPTREISAHAMQCRNRGNDTPQASGEPLALGGNVMQCNAH
jgi:hypothetical protein